MIVYEEIFKKYGLSATQQEIIKLTGKDKVVLEIGPSSGYMTKAFLQNNCLVDVVEVSKPALEKLPNKIRKIINYSIEDERIEKFLARDYDFIIMADVLEHLINPDKALKILYKIATIQTKLLISLPNIACWAMRKQLFFKGGFEYQDSGLLDRTHLHFYTVTTLPKLLSESRWKTAVIMGTIVRFPFEETINKIPFLGWIFKTFLYKNLANKYKNLSYYHFLTLAHK